MKRDSVEEAKSSNGAVDGTGRKFSFVGEVELVRTDLFRTQDFG
jgi:hypothetical protein